MAQNVYALFDRQEMKQNMFSAPETVLAKDAVMAFFEKNMTSLFGGESEYFKTMQSLISQSDSIESLSAVLVGHDFDFAMLQVS